MKSRKDSLRKRRLWGIEEEILSIYSTLLPLKGMRIENEVMPYLIENDTDVHAEEFKEKLSAIFH